MMDLRTAVAASMLPTNRAAIAAAFKDLYLEAGSGTPFLELIWAVAGRREPPPTSCRDIFEAASAMLVNGERLGLSPVPLWEARYPPLLASIVNPPPVLWVTGDLAHLSRRIVAIVGSRAASAYALQVAERLGAELAERGIVVASGLARGVDSAAHRGCLQAGGCTVAVQGCGLDRVYPAEHAALADQIAKNGAVLSELGPGAPPLPEHFPMRNRIISGISVAIVVVEASEQSGSLITARCALEQGRDVMAVPGSVLTGRNRGSHALLKDGARIVETADDVLQELGWSSAPTRVGTAPSISEPVLTFMDPGEPYGFDELVARSGWPGSKLLAALTELELRDLISSTSGKFVRRA